MIRKFLTASLVLTLSFVCIVYQLHAKNTEVLSEAEQYLEPNDSENKAAIQEKSKEINILLNTYFDFNSAFGRQLGHFGPGGKQTVRELMSSLVQFLEPCDSGIEERLAAYEAATMGAFQGTNTNSPPEDFTPVRGLIWVRK